MLSTANLHQRLYQYFQYENCPITPALCVNNGFHGEMHDRAIENSYLFTYQGKPRDTFRSMDISEIVYEEGKLEDLLAFSSAMALTAGGTPLPAGADRKHKKALVCAYLLNSSLVYVERKGKRYPEGFFATKNRHVVDSMNQQIKDADRLNEKFSRQLVTSADEVTANRFDVIRLDKHQDQFHASKAALQIGENDSLLPMYALGIHINNLINTLLRNRVLLTFRVGDEVHKLLTSLMDDDLTRWLQTGNLAAVKTVQQAWSTREEFGILKLPNLLVFQQYVRVPIQSITSLEFVQ